MSLSLSDLENQRLIEKEAFKRKGATFTVSDIMLEFGHDLYEAEKSLKIFSRDFRTMFR